MNRKQSLLIFITLFLFIPTCARAQQWSGIIDPSRAIDWSTSGVVGGIPNRTNICTTLGVPGQSYSFAQSVTAAQINSAISSCAANGIVFLNAGTYSISGGILLGRNNVTLRGTGADQTAIVFASGSQGCGGQSSNVCIIGSVTNWEGSPDHTANWTGTIEGGTGVYPTGATHLTLDSVTGLSVGNTIILDQLNDATDGFPSAGDIYVCDTKTTCVGQGGGLGRTGRAQEQQVIVSSISGSGPYTVTISPGLALPNWRASQTPGAWWASTVRQGVGVENLTLDNSAGTGALCSQCANITFYNAANCWVSGIRTIQPSGSGNPLRDHIHFYEASFSTAQNNYLYGSDNSSVSYGIEIQLGSYILIQNNISQHVTDTTSMGGPDTGSVIAYNFAIDDNYTAGGISPSWEQPMHIWHEAGQAMELYEGNSGTGFQADNIHGTHHFGTYFRNHYYGDIWNNPVKTANTAVMHLWKYSRFFNFIGNVLGSSFYNTYQSTTATSIFNVNGTSDGENGESTANDPRTAATLMRWGNYDTVNAASRFLASEVPSGITNFSNPVPASQTLPASFYLNAKPSWFGSVSWPPVGPDVTGGTGPGGHSYAIPAESCWYNVMGGVVGTSGLLSFNATKCYGPTATPPAAPTNLKVIVQ
jgi:hypothetical protein